MSMILEKNQGDFLIKIKNKLLAYEEKLTIQEVADIMGCGKEAVRKRVASGKIQSVRIGRADYIAKEWLIFYLENGGGLRKNLYDEKCREIVSFCSIPRTNKEIRTYIGYSTKDYTNLILRKLIAEKLIKQTELSRSNNQKYVSIATLE